MINGFYNFKQNLIKYKILIFFKDMHLKVVAHYLFLINNEKMGKCSGEQIIVCLH
jgi:hypothetical protein